MSIDKILVVTPEVERILGMTADQISRMTLGQLVDAAYEKGFRWKVNVGGGLVKGLTIRVAPPENQETIARQGV